jgi:Arm DNA-binding domain
MARGLKRLTARTVAAMTKPGRHADGQNLYLTISQTGGAVSRRWTFMFSFAGKQREAGLGSAAAVTLAEAREKAAGYRSMLAKGNLTRWTQRRPPGALHRHAKRSASAPMNS